MYRRHEVARKFFTGTSSSYDSVVDITTFGRDMVWKKAILDLIPDGNYKVLDLACGTGILSLAIARKVSYVIGIDIIEDMKAMTRSSVHPFLLARPYTNTKMKRPILRVKDEPIDAIANSVGRYSRIVSIPIAELLVYPLL